MPGTPSNPIDVYELTWQADANGNPPPLPQTSEWTRQFASVPQGQAERVQIVSNADGDPPRAGQFCARFELNNTDRWPPPTPQNPNPTQAARSELAARPDEPVGAERWYGFSIYLPDSWGLDRSGEILTQWHQADSGPGGSPPLALLTKNGHWYVSQRKWGVNDTCDSDIGSYVTGEWTDWVVHVKWSANDDDSSAFLKIWKNGEEVFQVKGGKNSFAQVGNYMKIGIYKFDWWPLNKPSDTTQRVMFHDEVRIADQKSGSYAAVAPPARISRNSMAYTFEELLANSLPYDPNTEYLTVVTTVVITQEDGRTGFVQDALVFEPTGKRLEKGTYNADSADDCFIYFSDRGRFGEKPDSMGIEITQGTNGDCNVLFTLKSWGSVQDRLSVALPQDYATTGKIYVGRGPTIGQGGGQALVCISFTTMEKHTIVMR